MTELITLTPHPENENIGVLHLHDESSNNTFTDPFVDEFLD